MPLKLSLFIYFFCAKIATFRIGENGWCYTEKKNFFFYSKFEFYQEKWVKRWSRRGNLFYTKPAGRTSVKRRQKGIIVLLMAVIRLTVQIIYGSRAGRGGAGRGEARRGEARRSCFLSLDPLFSSVLLILDGKSRISFSVTFAFEQFEKST